MIIFLWNNERVLTEVLNLGRLLIAQELGIKPKYINASVELDGTKVTPVFSVDPEYVPLAKMDEVTSIIQVIWQKRLRVELNARLASTQEKRYGYG